MQRLASVALVALVLLASAQPAGAALGPVLRDPPGTIRYGRDTSGQVTLLPYFDSAMQGAKSACVGRGGLPTIKQLALEYNPAGVSDTPRDGYARIQPNGEEAFYYDSKTYQQPPWNIPADDERGFWYWSSSIDQCVPCDYYCDPDRPHMICGTYNFGAFTGGIDWRSPDDSVAVRCNR
jgi:hypothetical protein